MSMTLVAMATEVAKSIGGQATQPVIDVATLAVKQSINDWNAAKTWNFLLRDNSTGFTVASVAWTGATTTINAPSTGAFDGVNKGITVSGTGIQADTTVTDFTYGSDNTVTSITLSQVTTGTQSGVTLTFGGYCPINAGQQDYNLPTDFSAPFTAYLRTNQRPIGFIKWREYMSRRVAISSTGPIEAYTIYHPVGALYQNYGTYRLRLVDLPGQSESLLLNYYSHMDPDATIVQVPDHYLYHLIEYAIWRFILRKNSEDTRLPAMEASAKAALSLAMEDDEGVMSEDGDVGLSSQMDTWDGDRPLFRNGEFYNTYP